jgi:hypothetical protein
VTPPEEYTRVFQAEHHIEECLERLLRRALGCDRQEWIRRHMDRQLQRNEEARFYPYKKRKRLAPQRVNQRE